MQLREETSPNSKATALESLSWEFFNTIGRKRSVGFGQFSTGCKHLGSQRECVHGQGGEAGYSHRSCSDRRCIGPLVLARKTSTESFMQASGKIEELEDAYLALTRELREEIRLQLEPQSARYLGVFSAPAANEPGQIVEAELFHVRTDHQPIISGEMAEAIWVTATEAEALQLAPLTRDHVLPMTRSL